MKIKLATSFFLVLAGTCVYSQNWQNAKYMGLRAGLFKFVGDRVDLAAIGDFNGLALRHGISPYVCFSLEADYGSFKPQKQSSSYKKDPLSPFRTFVFPITGSMRMTWLKESRIKPYLSIGAGVLFWDLRDVSGSDRQFWDMQGFRWGTRVSGFRKNLLLCSGVGLELYITRHLMLDMNARFNSLLGMKTDNVGYGDANNQIVQGTLTLCYTFGGFRDRDHDTIEDKYDQAPAEPEDFDHFEDMDGVPDPDNDADTVPDAYDRCPVTAEDRDGFQDEDGCPDIDNDNDGILDSDDQCRNNPEDFDGLFDQDGCPEADADNDGILDACDKCPNGAENFNSFQDEDGCPDVAPVKEIKAVDASPAFEDRFVLQGITFKVSSASLRPESLPILQQVVDRLISRPDVQLQIRGYTDSQGNPEFNLRLSQERAQAVLDYLVSRGVRSERLNALGYGDRDPVADNSTSAGRAKNRRIEFVRLK